MENVKLNKEFYPLNAINQAVKDFKEAASIKIRNEENHYKIEITPKQNIQFLKEEFANYVLGISKNKRVS